MVNPHTAHNHEHQLGGIAVIQARDDDGLDRGGSNGGDKKCLDSRYSSEIKLTGPVDALNMRYERIRGIQNDSMAFGLGRWVNGGTLNCDSKDCRRYRIGRNQFMLDKNFKFEMPIRQLGGDVGSQIYGAQRRGVG